MKRIITHIGLVFLIAPSIQHANIQHDLEKAFDTLDYQSNVTEASAYQGQSAGFYSGGNLYARNPIRNTSLASVDLPAYSGGCGGIDLYMGGFSYIKKEEAVKLAKAVMSDGMSYAFNLALETVTPLLSNTMKDLRNKINEINNMNINSCETAVGLVGAVFPKTQAAQKQICQETGSGKGGIFEDYTAARMGCGNGGRQTEVQSRLKSLPGHSKDLGNSMNFAWKAIKSNALFSQDNELSELMMSLSGTMIYHHEGNDDALGQHVILNSLASNDHFIDVLMQGGDLEIYGCDEYGEDECLHPVSNKKITLSKDKSIIALVRHKLNSMVIKIKSGDIPLSDAEKAFIQSTSLPIYKMLNVQSAFSKDSSILEVGQYSELIAIDLLFRYLEESLALVAQEARILQLPENQYAQFMAHIEEAQQAVRNKKRDSYEQRALELQLIEQTLLIEQRLASQLAVPIKDALSWADHL